MRRLIINADDFGYHVPRNEAVMELMSLRLLTSATVLLNQPETKFAITQALKQPGQFGLHLNLSEGQALSERRRLFASDGGGARRAYRLFREQRFHAAEILEQFRQAAVFNPTHVDGHFHVHTLPFFWRPTATAMRRHGVSAIRRYFTYLADETTQPLLKRQGKRLFAAYMKGVNGFRMTDYFCDVKYFMLHQSQLLRRLPSTCSIEIETHPDITGNADYELMKSQDFASALKRYELISYSAL